MIDFFQYMKKKYKVGAEEVCQIEDDIYARMKWYFDLPEEHKNQLVEFLYERDLHGTIDRR